MIGNQYILVKNHDGQYGSTVTAMTILLVLVLSFRLENIQNHLNCILIELFIIILFTYKWYSQTLFTAK